MWRLKYLIIGMIPSAVLGIALYLLAPEMRGRLARHESAIRPPTQSRSTFDREVPSSVEPGLIIITEDQLLEAVEDADNREDSWNINGLDVVIEDNRVSFTDVERDPLSDDPAIASAEPQIQTGRLVLTNRSGVLSIFKPARDAIANEIENQVAILFRNIGVTPISVTAYNGQLVIVTEPIGGASGTPVSSNTTPTAEPTRSGGPIGSPFNRTPTP